MYTVALPVETKVRELNGKLWLAAHLAERGYRVAIGELSILKKLLPVIKPNIYVGDSAVYKKGRIELYRKLKEANITIAVHDTEGGIIYSSDYYKGRLSLDVLKYVDCFLAWGEETVNIFKSVWRDGRIVVDAVGNPAFDLLSTRYRDFYLKEKNRLIARFGRFVLINTHFGFYNHFDREKYIEPVRGKFPGLFEFKKELFYAFIEAVKVLSETNKSIKFVIRPHPSENFERYKEIFADRSNVFVEHEYSVHPWALAACLVLHNGCTTGVETALLGKPVVSYRPVKSSDWDVKLPNLVSQQAEKISDLQNYVEQYCLKNSTSSVELKEEQKEVLEDALRPHDGRSAERICDVFDSLSVSDDIHPKRLYDRNIKKQMTRMLNDFRQQFLFQKGKRSKERYAEQKFSNISLLEMNNLLDVFKEINPNLSRVKIKKIRDKDNLFWVSRKY